MKVEEMIGKSVVEDRKIPRDMIGNKLFLGDLVSYAQQGPLLGKVTDLKIGGLSTPQGVTPTIMKVLIEATIILPPNQPASGNILKVCNPINDKMVENIMSIKPTS